MTRRETRDLVIYIGMCIDCGESRKIRVKSRSMWMGEGENGKNKETREGRPTLFPHTLREGLSLVCS